MVQGKGRPAGGLDSAAERAVGELGLGLEFATIARLFLMSEVVEAEEIAGLANRATHSEAAWAKSRLGIRLRVRLRSVQLREPRILTAPGLDTRRLLWVSALALLV